MNSNERMMASEIQLCRALLMACAARLDADGVAESAPVAKLVMEYLESSAVVPLHVEASELIDAIESIAAEPAGPLN